MAGIVLAFVGAPIANAQSAADTSTPEEYEPRILITEVATESNSSLVEEFIELTNVSEEPVDVTGWEVEYKSATGANWVNKAELAGTIYPEGSILLTNVPELLLAGGLEFSGGLASSPGGHIRLVWQDEDTSWVVEDKIGWGTANEPEETATPAPLEGKSMSRKIDEFGEFVDTNSNFLDIEMVIPNPRADNPEPDTEEEHTEPEEAPPADEEPENPEPEDEEPEEAPPARVLPTIPIRINELMIDPASPETDKLDEWIELYNPNSEDVDLSEYRLQTGSTFSYTYVIQETVIPAGGYVVFSSDASKLVLSNTAGAVRLMDFEGGVMDLVSNYSDVEEGEAYAWDGSAWRWTNTATYGSENIITRPIMLPKVLKSAAKKSTSVKAASTKKASSSKKTSAKKAAPREIYENPAVIETTPPVHPGVLAGFGALAVIYGVYEYRQDIGSTLRRFRSYVQAGSKSGAKAKGR